MFYTKHHLKFGKNQADNLEYIGFRRRFFPVFYWCLVLHTMYETHASMLLTRFDKITWGGTANKLHFIPDDKQTHLKRYYCSEDFDLIRDNLIYCMKKFDEDTQEVCSNKQIRYSSDLANAIIKNFISKS